MYDFDGYDLDIEDIVMDYVVKNHLKNFKGFTYQPKEEPAEEKVLPGKKREYPVRNIKTVDSGKEFL